MSTPAEAIQAFDAVAATTPTAFPARTKQAAGPVGGVATEVMLTQFTDKILLAITQQGRLAHWVHVPLEHPDPHAAERMTAMTPSDPQFEGSHLLPMPHLTATTILGASGPRDTLAQLCATQIASAISTRHPDEKRLLVVGLGLKDAELDREAFMQLLELVSLCLS